MAQERIEVLDKMVMRLYEDMIAGRISEQNFKMCIRDSNKTGCGALWNPCRSERDGLLPVP